MGKTKKVLKAAAIGAVAAGLVYTLGDVLQERKTEKAKFHEVQRGIQDIRYKSDKRNYPSKGTKQFDRRVDSELAQIMRDMESAGDLPRDFFM